MITSMEEFEFQGIRCVIVQKDWDYICAYVEIANPADCLVQPIDFHGSLPFAEGEWSGWAYPEEIPVDFEMARADCEIVIAKTIGRAS